MKLKSIVKAILGETLTGVVDYFRSPGARSSWEGSFNGQIFRQKIFQELISAVGFSGIAETGTFRGTTTEYLHASSQLPVYSVELHPRYHAFSKTRFLFRKDIHLTRGDSRSFLRTMVIGRAAVRKPMFFYLDAHWEADLPLREEILIIFEGCPEAIVMIDDFQVPGDEGYGYDDYGNGKVLSLEYLRPQIATLNLHAYFPAAASEQETGARRGCVVLAQEQGLLKVLDTLRSLKRLPTAPVAAWYGHP